MNDKNDKSERKKIMDVLMEDDTYIVKKSKDSSEVEKEVLKNIALNEKVKRISRSTGYPEVVVRKAIERLIDEGYLTEDLRLRSEFIYRRSKRIAMIDVGIFISAILLLLSILYYYLL